MVSKWTHGSTTELRELASLMSGSTPLSAKLLTRLAQDLDDRGAVGRVLTAHPQASTPLFATRALAGVRLLLLMGSAPELTTHLKSYMDEQGVPSYDARTWTLFESVFLDHPDHMAEALSRPVQQHHPRRASQLLEGLALLSPPGGRIRLLELGACAGLNLNVDRYRWFGPDWTWGPAESPVRLVSSGRFPGPLEIVDRAGCDLVPRDPGDPSDVLKLRSFLPHELEIDDIELTEALGLAAVQGARVDQADAVTWIEHELAQPLAGPPSLTVVWHSLFWGYLRPPQQEAIENILSAAARSMPLARITFEPVLLSGPPRLQITFL